MKKLFLDFDLTIVDSVKAYCLTYNDLFENHPKFEPADYKKCTNYDIREIAPLSQNIYYIFGHENFFSYCDFINENTKEILKKLNKKFHIIICSIGNPKNISLKTMWIKENIPFIKDYIMLIDNSKNNISTMGKSTINMKNSIIIDDHIRNLKSSNAATKICFGNYGWNKNWEGLKCNDWKEISDLLL
ncbi:MAG: 5' nucleotidase, NT5C type [bacterium]